MKVINMLCELLQVQCISLLNLDHALRIAGLYKYTKLLDNVYVNLLFA